MSGLIKEAEKGGFSFENCKRLVLSKTKQTELFEFNFCILSSTRNEYIISKGGYTAPIATKTGTTIAGIIFKDGVILGADTRATDGNIVAEKNCQKIHFIAPNI
jgi:20S proteasome subunit beta 2